MNIPSLISLTFLLVASVLPDLAKAQTPKQLFGPELADFVQTSASGDHFKALPPVKFLKGPASNGIVVTVTPTATRQTLEGIGGGLTESSAFVLANVSKEKRNLILDYFFSPRQANFTMARTHIGASDFCVKGKYSYDDFPGDVSLEHFSIAPDRQGFQGAKDPAYATLPMIKDALARQPQLKIVASPWTAPAWMKENNDWYSKGWGGALLSTNYDTFARYMVKYLKAYDAEGVKIWAVTPENEPLGNGGQWESMEFSDTNLRDYIKGNLGPQMASNGFSGVKIINFDHNRGADAVRYTDTVLGDPVAAGYVWGTGLHWYGTTISANPETMDQIHDRFPTKAILHTEGCIDNIGNEDNSPKGSFLGWKNDAWWWAEGATDWGWYWASKETHPKYAPVHRYARDIVDGLNHWFVGWIDWNIVLDKKGGPNHAKNLCAAPIMVDTDSEDVYITPLFYVMAHFSRYLHPGDSIVQVDTVAPGLGPDDFHATAAISQDKKTLTVIAFNKAKQALTYNIQVGGFHAPVTIPENAIQTLRFDLRKLK
jgi:glucosylceramidase